LTVNPDYSQVEVDRQQINLDRLNYSFLKRDNFSLKTAISFPVLGKQASSLSFHGVLV